MPKRRGQNEGSIFEESPGRWVAQLTAGYVIKDGKRRRVRRKFVASTRADVQKRLTRALNDQHRGRNVSPRVETLGAFLDTWLSEVAKQGVRPKTFQTYSDLLRLHVKPALGGIQIEKLTPAVIQTFLNDRFGSAICPHCKASFKTIEEHIAAKHPEEKTKPFRKLGAKTVSHIRATLRAAMATAVDWYDLDRNAAAIAKPPRLVKKEMRSLTPADAKRYLAAAAGHRLEGLFTAALSLGMRQGEILGLKWADVDLMAGTLCVKRSLQRVDGKLEFTETKTEDGARPLLLPVIAVEALRKHRTRQVEEREFAGDAWEENDIVFSGASGGPLDARGLIRLHHKIVKAAGIVPLRFHDIRHSAASLLLAQGVSPKYISAMLGHSQVSFTMQTYAHVLKETQQQLADTMDTILSPVAPRVAPSIEKAAIN